MLTGGLSLYLNNFFGSAISGLPFFHRIQKIQSKSMKLFLYSSISILPMAVVIRNRQNRMRMKEEFRKKYFEGKTVEELKEM